ncbi:N-acetyltransferase family protein [Roseomonas gilardii]|uniref:GCN5 family acetyltransferase n=1 Tax=Roseomonas gilardii TaxID=257708 RepID=A0A1L7AK35_9PROT|nr:GNAT family N-acetyltransferase [Roseomonas gilardii]APT59090.1 GCN5 family acetyltransferase [Roseomonas gilardii]MDT8332238.1 N-acetyltransferase family protein [Roseomonas gilardii]PZR09008.1 MAG: N-acetyltransferase [Azospirillum brasilense]
MPIRDARPTDLPAITAIYAHHVARGTGTFEEEAPDEAEMGHRLEHVQKAGWAWLVADNEAGEVVGYAYYAQFRDRSAYRFAAEDSIYIRDDVRGQGVGKALVAELLSRAEAAGFRQIFAVIGDAENVGSIGLHLSLGFRQTGVLRAAGLKFGRWLDVVFMQRPLGDGDRSLPSDA